jgi:hypothetical protein
MKVLKDNLNLINKISALFIILSAISIGVEASMNAKEQFLNIFYLIDIVIIAYFAFELFVRVSYNDKPLKAFIPALKKYLSKDVKGNLNTIWDSFLSKVEGMIFFNYPGKSGGVLMNRADTKTNFTPFRIVQNSLVAKENSTINQKKEIPKDEI